MYVQNNIGFRVVSSKNLENFYRFKSSVLFELDNERNKFSGVAKEIMLLFLHKYSTWCTTVEALLINRHVIDETDIQIILQRYGEIVEENRQTFRIYNPIFDPEFVSVWRKNHKHVQYSFKERVRATVGLRNTEAYPLIIDALVQALDSTKYELYEVDCLLGSSYVKKCITTNNSLQGNANLSMYVSNDILQYYYEKDVNLIKSRLQFYKETVLQDDVELNLVIKNYTNEKAFKDVAGNIIGSQTLKTFLTELNDLDYVNVVEIVS